MTANPKYKLSQEQIDHFMKYGYVRLPNCFSRAHALGAKVLTGSSLVSPMWVISVVQVDLSVGDILNLDN
jgi:multisubunit Na+/H+ antiporter MnhG subunit